MNATRVCILTTDGSGRWQAGDLGVLLVNDYAEKYAYQVLLDGSEDAQVPWDPSTEGLRGPRVYYFHSDEVAVLGTVDANMIESEWL